MHTSGFDSHSLEKNLDSCTTVLGGTAGNLRPQESSLEGSGSHSPHPKPSLMGSSVHPGYKPQKV